MSAGLIRRAPRGAAFAIALAAAASAGVSLAAAPARAEARCPVPAGAAPSLASVDGAARLAWIDGRLALTAHHARVWTWGWGIGIVGGTLANLVPLAFVAPNQRIDWYTGAATTIVGIVPLLIAPLDVVADSRALRARLTPFPGTDADVCGLLSEAEAMLVRDAKNQADGRRWWLHAGNVALNTGVGLFLGLGYHHWWAGAFNAVFGTAIGEAIILTQPTGSIDDLARYRAGPPLDGAPAVSALAYRGIF